MLPVLVVLLVASKPTADNIKLCAKGRISNKNTAIKQVDLYVQYLSENYAFGGTEQEFGKLC